MFSPPSSSCPLLPSFSQTSVLVQQPLSGPPRAGCPSPCGDGRPQDLRASGELVSPSKAAAAGAGRRCQDLRVAPQISFPAQAGPHTNCCLCTNWHTPILWFICKPSIPPKLGASCHCVVSKRRGVVAVQCSNSSSRKNPFTACPLLASLLPPDLRQSACSWMPSQSGGSRGRT